MIRKLWCWIVGTGCQWQCTNQFDLEVDGRTTKIEWIDRCARCGATRKGKVER
jgi:hypothetical protein